MAIPTELINPLIALFDSVSIVVVVGSVAKAFEWFDKMVSDRSRQELTRWLTNVPGDAKLDSRATIFANLIDKVFGERALSFEFIMKSCGASLLAVLIVTFIFYRFGLVRSLLPSLRVWFGIAFMAASVANFIPDYFSLLISRTIVRLMARKSTPIRITLLLIADTAMTGIVAALGVYAVIVACRRVNITNPADV
jgi:hypothetical protein